MKVTFSFVPPGGGEQEYATTVSLPVVPRTGDVLHFQRPNEHGDRPFLIRSVHWRFEGENLSEVYAIAEYVRLGPLMAKAHTDRLAQFEEEGLVVKEIPLEGW